MLPLVGIAASLLPDSIKLIFRSWVSNLRLQTETGLSRSFILFSPKKGAHP
jgi:hypothetical protein